ncbi:MAG: branched-chain amino acid ABC transporter substrate-binding protein [Solirubrobacterales bacterium]|nr:branched-chain amino acid ABC transporter substrate-binding protein [Solirubrobacterales bacterium]
MSKAIALCLVVTAAVVLGACGGGKKGGQSTGPGGQNQVDVYSSLPLQGPGATQSIPIVNGMKLALSQSQGRAGQWSVNYQSLDDSTAATGTYDPTQAAANARKVVVDPKAVYYVGEFNSGASEASIPILNQAGVPQVSPASTYVGLTTNEPGSAPGEPRAFYPSGKRSFLRLVPRDSIQAAADLTAMKQAGCTKVAVANDRTPYGAGLAQLLELEKGLYGVTITSNVPVQPGAPDYRPYAATVKSQGADCFLFAGIVANGGVQITEDVNSALPKAKIFGPDGMCTRSWTSARAGGVPPSIDPLIECTVATPKLSAYPAGRAFQTAYKARYGNSSPDPYAVYGYEAMKLALATIAKLGPKGNSKSTVLSALFATKDRRSVLGTYSFDRNGDTTLRAYGLYKVGPDGSPAFYKTLTPGRII